MTTSALTLLIYTPTPLLLLLPGGTSLNCLSKIQDYYFMNTVTNDWNSLPTSVVESTSINTFKLLLDNYLLDFRFTFVHWSGIQTLPLPVFNHNHNHITFYSKSDDETHYIIPNSMTEAQLNCFAMP